MNEEEKKAIEKIKEIIECFYCFPNPTSIELKDCDCSTLEISLNLIEKMRNCIIILDDELKERNKTINEKEIIIEQLQKENEDLKAKLEYKEYGDLDNVEFEKYINYIVDTRTKELKEENEKLKYKYAEYVKFSIRKIEEMMDEEENK